MSLDVFVNSNRKLACLGPGVLLVLLEMAIKSKENIQTKTIKGAVQYQTPIMVFIILLTHANVDGEALQLHTVYKEPYFFTTSHARIRITNSTSHVRTRACRGIKSLSP